MYDILPESSPRPSTGRRKQTSSDTSTPKAVYAGPRVVQVEWKLPSRLRKPIREQLSKERAQRRRRAAAAVTFARKPIRTQALMETRETSLPVRAARVQKPRRFFNRGAEHHTNDIYKQSKPQLRVAAPPYLGKVARATTAPEKTVPIRPQPPRAAKQVTRKPMARTMKPVARRMPAKSAMPFAERDIPMQWEKTSVPVQSEAPTQEMFASIERPKKFLPGLTFSLWPGNWFAGESHTDIEEAPEAGEHVFARVASQTSKKKRLIF